MFSRFLVRCSSKAFVCSAVLIKDSEIEKVNYFEEMLEENERLEKSKIREELNLESEIKSAKRMALKALEIGK